MLIGVGGFAFGVYSFYKRQIDILKDLSFNVASVKIVDSSFQETKLLITLNVVNRSEINFTITGYKLSVLVNEQPVSVVNNKRLNEKVKGLGQLSKINFYATFSPEQVLGSDFLTAILNSLGNTDIRIKGDVATKKWGLPLPKYPLDLSLKLKDFI